MKSLVKILKNIFVYFFILIILFNAYTLFARIVLNEPLPKVFGFTNAVVISGSMEPEIHICDMVIIKEQKGYAVDDTVTYTTGKTSVTHKIIAVTQNGYITQGTANNTPDSEITKAQVVGKVVAVIPQIGYLIDFLRSPFGMLMIIITGLLIIELPRLIKRKPSR